eukprot:GAHX01002921.1.p1 GENE.GAHX01002921.1~~GAHX01002921.1.p1  ORF type:complete len:346 (-),score=49.16 GAHX01002921.1:52-1089(-)
MTFIVKPILSLWLFIFVLHSSIDDLAKINNCSHFKKLYKGNKPGYFDGLLDYPPTGLEAMYKTDHTNLPQCIMKLKTVDDHTNFSFLREYKSTDFDQIIIWLRIYINSIKLFRKTFDACFENFFSLDDHIFLHDSWIRGSYGTFFNGLVFGQILEVESRIMCKLDYLVDKHSIRLDSDGPMSKTFKNYAAFTKLVFAFIDKREREHVIELSKNVEHQSQAAIDKLLKRFVSFFIQAANIVFYESVVNVMMVLFEIKETKQKIELGIKKSVFATRHVETILKMNEEAVYQFRDFIDILNWKELNTLLEITEKDVHEREVEKFMYVVKHLNETLGELVDIFLLSMDW